MWKFANTEDPTNTGISDAAIEAFRDKGSLMRELIQNSLDAKRDDKDSVKIEIKISKKKTSDFPKRINLKGIVEDCLDEYKNEEKARVTLNSFVENLESDDHMLVSFFDTNTKGLEGTIDDEDSTFAQLIYGNGSTNKNKSTSTAGSFGIGKNAPFAKAGIRTIFYETYNIKGNREYVGKAKLTTHKSDGEKKAPNGYLNSTDVGNYELIEKYLGENRLPEGETGTGIHIPFYLFSKSGRNFPVEQQIIMEEKYFIYDIIDNFMVSIYNGKLEANIQGEEINKSTLEHYVDEVDDAKIYKDQAKRIKAMYNAITKGQCYDIDLGLGEGERCLFYLALNDNAIGLKETVFMREQLMKIISTNKYTKIINKYDAVCIFEGTIINNVLRASEPPEHDKWVKKYLNTPTQKDLFKRAFDTLKDKVREIMDSKVSDSLVLKEFNNDFLSDEKEKNEVFKITTKKKPKKTTIKTEVTANFINGTEKVKEKKKLKDKLMPQKDGNNKVQGEDVKIIDHAVRKVRNVNDGTTKFYLKDNTITKPLNNYAFSLGVRTEDGTLLVDNFEVDLTESNEKFVVVNHNEGNVSLILQVGEKNENL